MYAFLGLLQGLQLGLRLLAGLLGAPVALLALVGVHVQLAAEALEGEAVGALRALAHGIEGFDLLVGVVGRVGAALLQGLEGGQGHTEAVSQALGFERRA